jgi:hypothetical protein
VIAETEGPALPPELAELQALAAGADAQLADAGMPPGAEPAPAVDRGAELGAMLQMGVMIATPAMPFLPQCYTPDVCAQIGTAFAAVAEKHGWNLDNISSPELALAVVTLPPTITAIVMGRAHFAAKRAAEHRQAMPPAPQPLRAAAPVDQRPHAGQRLQPVDA